MKVAIGSKYIDGPYGGGNLFIKNIKSYLIENNHNVVFELKDKDIDIILLINPLYDSEHSTFNHLDIIYYQKFINPEAISIQRINECDERKNTNYVNKQILNSNKFIDHTIFVSTWIKNLFVEKGLQKENSNVILSGSDSAIFNRAGKSQWNKKEPIKLVTHHWSGNWMKGFETYLAIDKLLQKDEWKNKLKFFYIGNIPNDLNFENTKVIPPLDDVNLALELKKKDIYITGSINEPSGNHHIEAAQCGLPILFIESGGIPEYCKGYGIEFTTENLEEKLKLLISQFDDYFEKMEFYLNSSEKMGKEFLAIFEKLIEDKNEILEKRDFIPVYKVFMKILSYKFKRFVFIIQRKFYK